MAEGFDFQILQQGSAALLPCVQYVNGDSKRQIANPPIDNPKPGTENPNPPTEEPTPPTEIQNCGPTAEGFEF